MIYQPRNVQPSNSAVDGNKDNIFTMEAQTNSYISSYQLLISDFNNDDIYIGDKTDLASYAYNGDTISIPVNADTVKLSNGSDYKWRVKLYQPTADMLITYGLVQQTSTETNIYTQPNINIRVGMAISINGQTQIISSYDVDTGVAVVETAFSSAPNVGSQYVIYSDFIETVPDYIVYARETPTVSISNIPSSLTLKYNTFQGVYNQSDNVPIVYHQFDLYLQNADGSNTLIDTSGKVYSANLSYTYNSFRTGNTYAIQMTVENDMGIVVSTDLYSFNVSYDIVEYLQQPQATFNSQQNAVKISWVAPVENEAVSTLSNVASGTVQNNNNTDTTAYFEPGQVISQGDIVRLINSDFNLKVDGKSQQVTTTGKNLFYVEPKTLNGVTLSYANDGAIVLNGTATADCFFRTKLNNPIETESTLSYKINSLINTVIIRTRNVQNVIQKELNTSVNLTNKLTKTSNDEQAEICVINGTKLDNYKIYIQLEEGDTATEIEPFSNGVPSPSPDYPQEVEVARGNNLFYVEPKTLNGVTLSYGKDGAIVLNGTATDYTQIKSSINLSNNTYTLSNISNKGFSKSLYVVTRDADGNLVQQLEVSNTTKVSLTSTSAISSCEITIIKGTNVDGVILQPQLQKGKVFTEYEPYNSIVAKVNGKNLFDKNNASILNAYISSSNVIVSNDGARTIYIPCESNKTYTIQKRLSKSFSFAYSDNIPTINSNTIGRILNNSATSLTITTGDNAKYLLSQIYTSGDTLSEQEILDSIQIEEGTIASEYEPYQESKLTFNLNTEQLCSITDVADELNIDLSNGNYNKTENITKVVLDGSEEGWEYNSTYKYFRCPTYNYGEAIPLDLKGTQKCNYFQIIEDWATFRDNINKNSIFRINNEGYKICIRNTTYTTVEEWKQWLSEHPVEVYYQLETPITTQLGTLSADDLAKFNSINGTAYMNIITNIDTNYYLVYPSTSIMKSTNQNSLFNPAGKSQTVTTNSYNKVTGAIDLMNNSKFLYIPVQGDAYQVIGNIYNETGFQILYNTPYNSVNSLYTHGYTATWAAPDGLCVLPDDFNITLQFSPDSNFYYNSDGTYQEVVNLITANTDDVLDNGDFAIKIDKNKLIFTQNPDINLELPFYTNTTQVFVLSPDSAPQINNDYIWDDSATWNDTYIWVEGGTSIERVCNHWWKVQITNTTIKIEEIFPTS